MSGKYEMTVDQICAMLRSYEGVGPMTVRLEQISDGVIRSVRVHTDDEKNQTMIVSDAQ